MNKNWKTFIIVISALLCTVIVCLTINISIGKITKSMTVNGTGNTNASGDNSQAAGFDTQTDGANSTTAAADVTTVTDASGNIIVVTNNNAASGTTPGSGVTNSGTNSGGSAAASTNPLSYSKAQLVNYYNTCLKKSYSQPKMTDVKSEKITVAFDDKGVLVNGETSSLTTSVANIIINANSKDKTYDAVTFTNGNSSEGSATKYILPTGLTAAGVKSATISKSGSGYHMVITLIQESCDFKTKPYHNKSCSWPLDFTDIDFKGYAEITSATFTYPGTKLTADIDANGRVTFVQTTMPLSVKNASGTMLKLAKGTVITVSEVSGQWVCKNNLTF